MRRSGWIEFFLGAANPPKKIKGESGTGFQPVIGRPCFSGTDG
jgi:hypothetical protein